MLKRNSFAGRPSAKKTGARESRPFIVQLFSSIEIYSLDTAARAFLRRLGPNMLIAAHRADPLLDLLLNFQIVFLFHNKEFLISPSSFMPLTICHPWHARAITPYYCGPSAGEVRRSLFIRRRGGSLADRVNFSRSSDEIFRTSSWSHV